MKKKLKTTIKVKIGKITVNEGYYFIDYVIDIDGKKKKGIYDGGFDSQSDEQFKKVLENGSAINKILQLWI